MALGDRDHTHGLGHAPSARRAREERPLRALWSVTKDGAERHAYLHGHELGFELRILDEHMGEPVFSQVRESEAEIVTLAATHHKNLLASGWVEVPDTSVGQCGNTSSKT
jgi:hypothetical protein